MQQKVMCPQHVYFFIISCVIKLDHDPLTFSLICLAPSTKQLTTTFNNGERSSSGIYQTSVVVRLFVDIFCIE